MKKHLIFLTLILCLLLAACGTSAKFASGLKTDSITIYDIATGETEVITDAELISDIIGSADTGNWKKQSKLSKQISATPNYAFDFGNETCIGLLGDGYVLVGTAFEYLSEDHQSYRFVDGCQYQVPAAFTDLLEEITLQRTEK